MHNSKRSYLLGVCILALLLALLSIAIIQWPFSEKWRLKRTRLLHTLETGIAMQAMATEYRVKFRRNPNYSEFVSIITIVAKIAPDEFVTTEHGRSSAIVDKLDGSGGWFYDSRTGNVKLNALLLYEYAPSTSVDVSQIEFDPIITVRNARHQPTFIEQLVVYNGYSRTQAVKSIESAFGKSLQE
jgi:hypothetical protein